MDILYSLGGFLFLIALGTFVGGAIERRHFRLLDEREGANGEFLITQLKSYPHAVAGPTPPTLFFGEAVISSDYLKSFLGGIRKIFGGEMRSYQSLLVRARREALQRVVEEARSQGYNAVCNVRYYSTDISGASKAKKKAVMVTLLAAATAYHAAVPQGAA
jgi:uncharacterized protein YbjQ (UPF0145 family)